jgi:hypothetical protein
MRLIRLDAIASFPQSRLACKDAIAENERREKEPLRPRIASPPPRYIDPSCRFGEDCAFVGNSLSLRFMRNIIDKTTIQDILGAFTLIVVAYWIYLLV